MRQIADRRKIINKPKGNRKWIPGAVGCFLAILFLQLFLSVRYNSITWDEDNHIYAGYMSLMHADFGLNPEHPPLVKMLSAIPLLGMNLQMPALQDRYFKTEAFLGGKDFVFKNNFEVILDRARLSAALLTLLTVFLVFLAAKEMFGTGAAFIALALLVFDPNILAHGAVVGTDMGLSCFMFASVYAFYRYVKAPSPWRLVLVGIATGLALASKHTAILVWIMLALLAITEIAGKTENVSVPRKIQALRLGGALIAIGLIAVAILWAFYGFRYQARPGNLQINPPFAETVQQLSRPHEIRLLSTVANWHLLPESYVYGLADVRIMSDFYTSYIFGTTYPHGVWFYFPAAFAIKSSLAFLVLLAFTVWVIASKRLNAKREILFLTIPPVFHLAVAMYSGMNIGVRHILPMYLFLAVLVAGAMWKLIEQKRGWIYAVIAILVFQAISTTRIFPAYMAYANELWGGSSQTYKYLTDSNSDWGQQLKSVKRYLDRRGIKDCWFIYFAQGVVDFRDYGIPCKPLPTMDSLWVNGQYDAPSTIEGTVLISAGDLSGFEFGAPALNPYEQFKQMQPKDVIDYSIFVYQGRFEIPMAASLRHSQKAADLLAAKQFSEALTEAQQAVTFAPDAVRAHSILGDVLAAMGRPDEARQSYEKALTLAKTIAPEFQVGWVDGLEKKLAR